MKDSCYKTIRSFVRREGRITKAQQQALQTLMPIYGLSPNDNILDFDEIFHRQAKTTIEIGFGNGETFVEMASQNPDINFIGIEVHRPGVGACLQAIHQLQLDNVRIICQDATEVLKCNIADHSVDVIQIFFPDPWPKKRHHKRRLIQKDFIDLVEKKLKSGGLLHLATDWENYAEQMLTFIEENDNFVNQAGKGNFSQRPSWRPQTKFEKRGERLKHGVWDLIFRKD